MKKYLLLICFGIGAMPFLKGQSITIEGIIKDVKTGELMVYANILQVGTVNGTISDVEGKFRLDITERTYNELEITFIGYETIRIQLDFTIWTSHPKQAWLGVVYAYDCTFGGGM